MKHLAIILLLSMLTITNLAAAADEFGVRPSSINSVIGAAYVMPYSRSGNLYINKDTWQGAFELGRMLIPHFFVQFSTIGGIFKGNAKYKTVLIEEMPSNVDVLYGLLAGGFKGYLFSSFFFQPFVEGGALFGYHQLKWKEIQTQNPLATKITDGSLMMGTYYGTGVDIVFTNQFGIRGYYRYQLVKGKNLETLDNSAINIRSQNIYLGFITRF